MKKFVYISLITFVVVFSISYLVITSYNSNELRRHRLKEIDIKLTLNETELKFLPLAIDAAIIADNKLNAKEHKRRLDSLTIETNLTAFYAL